MPFISVLHFPIHIVHFKAILYLFSTCILNNIKMVNVIVKNASSSGFNNSIKASSYVWHGKCLFKFQQVYYQKKRKKVLSGYVVCGCQMGLELQRGQLVRMQIKLIEKRRINHRRYNVRLVKTLCFILSAPFSFFFSFSFCYWEGWCFEGLFFAFV